MGGLNNLKGKKAAPFVKGGGRSKSHPNDAKGKKRKQAMAVLKKAKSKDLATGVSGHEADLAGPHRYKHGWIRIDGTPATKSTKATSKKSLVARAKKALSNAQRAMSASYGKSTSLSNGATGTEIDLDWSQWNANHKGKGNQGTRQVEKTGKQTGVSFKEIKAFKASVPGTSKTGTLGPVAMAALERRSKLPGHFRAKAILAAEKGDTKGAAKFQALHVAAQAKRRAAAPATKQAAPAKGTSHPSMVKNRFTKASAPAKAPAKKPGKSGVPVKYRLAAKTNAAHAKAIRISRAG